MDINELKGFYFASEHDLDREVFHPLLVESDQVDCMTGYFSSGALRELAYSLSYFLKTRVNHLRFIVSPNFSDEDIKALLKGVSCNENLIPLLFPSFEISEETLRKKTLEALSYLIIKKRLVIKVAIQATGLFHTKCWTFHTNRGGVVIHGSVNATSSGISHNFEQLALNKSWENRQSKDVVDKISHTFERIWNGEYKGLDTLFINENTLSYLESVYREAGSFSERKIDNLLVEELRKKNLSIKPSGLSIPAWINYTSGDFSHQGEAITAWAENSGRGILSIATGGGKTLTSLIAASLVSEKEKRLLLVIAVPTVALVDQWVSEVVLFKAEPLNTQVLPPAKISPEINKKVRNLKHGISKVEVVIVTHDAIKSDKICRVFDKASRECTLMLIGDEVHNLGSIGFRTKAKDYYKYRLGLSATHERQFDDEGTDFLLNYFGDVVYEYGLSDAIGGCLVPFEYHVHKIFLTDDEEEDWFELTQSIKKLSYASKLQDGSSEKEVWKLLCLKRRRIVESASGKVSVFASALSNERSKVRRTLVFCTDKYPEQLKSVNEYLIRRKINFHQVTSEETSNKKKLKIIVEAFDSDELQILTSKRVLDEGFNIPQTEVAFLLASNTVKRQWVQRLGRVLRKSKKTGKVKAVIHDFLVLPSSLGSDADPDLVSLIYGEYSRLKFFNSLSLNGLENNGSSEVIDELLYLIGGFKSEHRIQKNISAN